MNVIITVSASYPPKVGSVRQTLFGDITITQAMADSGYYNDTIVSQVGVQDLDTNVTDLQSAVTRTASELAAELGNTPAPIPPVPTPIG